jgi:hypothetical protein
LTHLKLSSNFLKGPKFTSFDVSQVLAPLEKAHSIKLINMPALGTSECPF